MKSGMWVLTLLVLMFAACSDGVCVHHYEHVRPEGWVRTDTLHFQLPAVPNSGTYLLNLGVRYTHAFPYESIWLVTETQLQHPTSFRHDTLNLILNTPEGMPVGQGVGLLQYELTLDSLQLHKGQSGSISIYHIMSREAVPGIHDIGIRLSEHHKDDGLSS